MKMTSNNEKRDVGLGGGLKEYGSSSASYRSSICEYVALSGLDLYCYV